MSDVAELADEIRAEAIKNGRDVAAVVDAMIDEGYLAADEEGREALIAAASTPPLPVTPRRQVCTGCYTDFVDPPSKYCPGCQAYAEHQR